MSEPLIACISTKHSLTVLPLQLADLPNVKTFAQETLKALGQDKLDLLVLNAAITKPASLPNPNPKSKWCESYVVNHLAQHYLVHLLRAKLVQARDARIVFVSSGAVRMVKDPSTLENDLQAGSTTAKTTYPDTKFTQLLAAHWWRRQLAGECTVVAVSPGFIPGTGLARDSGSQFPANAPDAKSVPEGAASILASLTRTDFPADPEQIFLTSWGEWWPKDTYANSLDRALQDKWCLSQEEIEREEGVGA
ncbi:hypothetical protein B0H11DRAFT_1878662 [Mycena galericulata]|nr:hypothetical protein B0H11DRAFT_1878662 [Mycena galericulata]